MNIFVVRLAAVWLLQVAVCLPVANAGTITVVGDLGDGQIDVNGLPQDIALADPRVGVGGNNLRGLAVVYFFELPVLSPGATITDARLQVEYLRISPASVTTTPEFNVDVFGIDARADAIMQARDYYDGDASLSSDTLLQTSAITNTTPPGNLSVANLSLLNFIASLYNNDGTPISTFATFRLNPDKDLPVGSGAIRGYDMAMADHPNALFHPRLTVTAIPEPSSVALWSFGAVGVLALARRRPRQERVVS